MSKLFDVGYKLNSFDCMTKDLDKYVNVLKEVFGEGYEDCYEVSRPYKFKIPDSDEGVVEVVRILIIANELQWNRIVRKFNDIDIIETYMEFNH